MYNSERDHVSRQTLHFRGPWYIYIIYIHSKFISFKKKIPHYFFCYQPLISPADKLLVHSFSKVMGFFFKHKQSDTYTLCIDLKNYKHNYEMFCDIYTRFDKISQSRYGSVTVESRTFSKNALQNWDAGVTYRNTSVRHNSLKLY